MHAEQVKCIAPGVQVLSIYAFNLFFWKPDKTFGLFPLRIHIDIKTKFASYFIGFMDGRLWIRIPIPYFNLTIFVYPHNSFPLVFLFVTDCAFHISSKYYLVHKDSHVIFSHMPI